MQITLTYKEIEVLLKASVAQTCNIPADRLRVVLTNELKCKDRNVTATVEILDEK